MKDERAEKLAQITGKPKRDDKVSKKIHIGRYNDMTNLHGWGKTQ